MTEAPAATDGIADLARRAADANAALIGGDVRRYLDLVAPADDFTLMSPFGGEPTRGFDRSDAFRASLERFFRGGTASFELVRGYASGDMVVLAAIERQRAVIRDLPEQDWSLRVTLVFRREGGAWRLVHRHADPLAHGISLQAAAALARG
jgi:ketosteroid isomerase-like protein